MRYRPTLTVFLATAALGAAALPASADDAVSHSAQADTIEPGAREAVAVVEAFHKALGLGDVAAALAHLSEDAVVFESGGIERGKAAYAAHHAPADAAFAKAVPSRVVRRAAGAARDVAWILTEGRTTGTYKEKPVDRVTTETMVLRREGAVWRIVHVHWSSAAARAGS